MEENHIYQYSLVNALMAGASEFGISVAQFSRKGNQGLGTFSYMDGELVLLDGTVYQLQAGGDARVAGEEAQIPYGMSTNFVPQATHEVSLTDKNAIDRALTEHNKHASNLFMTYRIEGHFEHLKCRTVRGQEYKGQPLSELGEKQSVKEYSGIDGTIIGFNSPEAFQGFSVAGDHLHFIDKDRTTGGHVLELKAKSVRIGIATAANIHIELPVTKEFDEAELETNDAAIKKVED